MGRRKKKQVKRTIKLIGSDIELIVSKVTAVRTQKKMLHFDELPDGTWRIIYNEIQIPDFTKIEGIDITRE